MAFEDSFRTKQKDARGRSIFKDRASGTLFTVDPETNKQIVGRPGGGRQESGGGGGGDRPQPRADSSNVARQEFDKLPNIEDRFRQEERQRQERLRKFVDPVLASQSQIIEGLRGRESIESLFNKLRSERGVPQTEALLKALQQQALDIEGELGDLPEDVTKRTRGTMTTESQRRRVLQKERGPLTDQLTDLLRSTERERAGFSTTLQDIQDILGIRVQQESRDIEPSERALQFGGQNLDFARQNEADRLQTLLSGITGQRQTELSRIGSLVGSSQQKEQAQQQESLTKLQAELSRQAQLEQELSAGISTTDQDFLVGSAQDLAERGVPSNEIVRILQGSKPNVEANQIQALVELATTGFSEGGAGAGSQGNSQNLSRSLQKLVRGGDVTGLKALPKTKGKSGTGDRAPLF